MRSLIIFFILTIAASAVFGQQTTTTVMQDRAAQYVLGGRDEILIRVNIWGYVTKPGQYLVPRNTDLVTLISFAGGPRAGANLSKVRIIREEPATNGYGDAAGTQPRQPVMKVNVKRFMKTGQSGIIPVLKPGDTVLITPSFGEKFKQSLAFVSTVTIIAQTAWWITLIVTR